nr:G-type lectin S-receptor-like serine/threonine-protein kinase At4g27290 isoform X1 [Coffea arabica]XP_027105099.1 G-type lectin S-receptor-like serine/threonine-protein kinase At4g27290 isoform X1 [Coffea arabica]XP_027111625.1 G-type lectin S-receptor-like serine/threonine-protein kinase At4g27290 isoform X1 [Coffea arabica]
MGFSLIFSVLAIFTLLASYRSIAADILAPNQNLTDGQTLVSSNQIFALGFFSPGNSGRKYLGIWYHNQPLPLTVVWVANRDNPINDSSGGLIMSINGSLFLYNKFVWFTITNGTMAGQSPLLQLLDTGNLVVRKQDEADGKDYIWQSFDHMSGTMLPGMKLGWNLKTGTSNIMRSWKNFDDPSDGEFTFSLDPPETPQLILRQGETKKYRWGPFDGDRFSGSNELRNNTVFKPIFVSTSDEVYYAYETLDDSTLVRSVVTPLGSIQYLTWRNTSRDWNMIVELNRIYCDKYGMCGQYGSCYTNDPNCRCLNGFVPNSLQDWRLFNSLGGCKRRYNLNCSNGDGFVKYNALKLPDNAVLWANFGLEECRAECLKKCDCMAYTRINVLGNGSQCVVWLHDLIDMRDSASDGEELFIRMARAELDSIAENKRRKRIRVAIGISISTAFLLVLLAMAWQMMKRVKRRAEEDTVSMPIAHDNNSYNHYEEESQDEDLELPIFGLATIVDATDQFAFGNKIGQGGFGPVYKGKLPNGSEIAVKRLSQDSGQGLREFKNEVKLIANLQHRNLVKLLGCCIQGEEKMLVYEYLPNKSLDNFIFDRVKRKLLPWNTRFDIVLGIARGLLYLHQDSRLRIIHRDLKTSNILLDIKMNPKISDFGIARIFGGEQTEEKTRRVIGTYGYMSPEYAMSGHFSIKSDVFSFGVIVLELISGRKNWGFYDPGHDYNLIGHTWKLWNEDRCLELVDEMLDGSFSIKEVIRCIQVALLCVQQRAEDRPAMSTVVFMLSNENVELPQPKEPGFITENSPFKIDPSWSGQDSNTGNELTITAVEGR